MMESIVQSDELLLTKLDFKAEGQRGLRLQRDFHVSNNGLVLSCHKNKGFLNISEDPYLLNLRKTLSPSEIRTVCIQGQ